MFKKLLVASAVIAISSTFAFANAAPYIGASLGIKTNTDAGGNFRGAPLSIFGGYGATINQNIYLGGELSAELVTATLDNHYNTMKTTYGYGVSFMPGYMLSDHTLAFARIGVERSRFSQLSTMKTGAQVGLGLQASVTQNWDLRGEYDYTAYQSSINSDEVKLGLVYKID